jgi:hypothetical protein
VDSLRWPRDTLYPLKWALTSPTSGGRSVGIVRACELKPRSFLCVLFLFISFSTANWQYCRCGSTMGRKHGDLESCLIENYQRAYKLNTNLLINKTFNNNFRISARFIFIITELDCWECHREEQKVGRGILKKKLNFPVGTEENQRQTQNSRYPGRHSIQNWNSNN